jgi:hypothetical protein
VATLIKRRKEGDCGVAALAMFAEVAYEDAYVAFAKLDICRGGMGLYNRQVIAAAKFLGLSLVACRKFDLDVDEGVLAIKWLTTTATHKAGAGHFVCLVSSVIVCSTDGTVMYWKEYLERHHGKAVTLLKE